MHLQGEEEKGSTMEVRIAAVELLAKSFIVGLLQNLSEVHCRVCVCVNAVGGGRFLLKIQKKGK
jgi:hypothetical protein